jgi:hypothetical protein
MNEMIEDQDALTVQLLESLAETIVVQRWSSDEDIATMAHCWVILSQHNNTESDVIFATTSWALSAAFYACANNASEDFEVSWSAIFMKAERICRHHLLFNNRPEVSEFIISMSRDHVFNLGSKESVNLYFKAWENRVWSTEDKIESEAAAAAIVAFCAMFGSLMSSLTFEQREDMFEVLWDTAQEHRPPVDCEVVLNSLDIKDLKRVGGNDLVQQDEMTDNAESLDFESTATIDSDKESWQATLNRIIASRSRANKINNRKQCKPFYNDSRADYLAEAVSRTLHTNAIPRSSVSEATVLANPNSFVLVDSSKIVHSIKPTLKNAPQAAIKGRLISMFAYFNEVECVEAIRVRRDGLRSFTGDLIPADYVVALVKVTRPIARYRNNQKHLQ